MLIQVRNDNVWPTSRVKMIKMMVSPRQAQDKHRESTQKRRLCFISNAADPAPRLDIQAKPGEKNVLFAMPFIYKNDLFTKTGSGQT